MKIGQDWGNKAYIIYKIMELETGSPVVSGEKKSGRRSWKFWLAFWIMAAVLLSGWYVYLQVKNRNFENLKPLANILPVGEERRNELQTLADIYSRAGGFDREQTFLVLFQNDMELRPGGGFLGSFGVLSVKSGRISNLEIYDTGVFDARIPDGIAPPAPIAETFHIASWKLRDSNWSPDFAVNAEKAEYFYHLGRQDSASQGGGVENLDGVIAINTDVLNSILSITGPVKMDDYPGEYNNETAVLRLEYQVEKGYREQGIEKGERKSVMRAMAATLMEKIRGLTLAQQFHLAGKIEEHLKEKDIQMFFKNEKLQSETEKIGSPRLRESEAGWAGRVKDFAGDYLMLVDANLNSLKSDLCLKRSLDYQADFHGEVPQATLRITYEHTCRTRDWLTTNYYNWQRVYVPAGAALVSNVQDNQDVEVSNDLGKTVFAREVYVPIGETRMTTLKYNLPASTQSNRGEPAELKENSYSLLIQKQSGSGELPVKIEIKKPDGSVREIEDVLTGDKEFLP